jgi:hypothetical protein
MEGAIVGLSISALGCQHETATFQPSDQKDHCCRFWSGTPVHGPILWVIVSTTMKTQSLQAEFISIRMASQPDCT